MSGIFDEEAMRAAESVEQTVELSQIVRTEKLRVWWISALAIGILDAELSDEFGTLGPYTASQAGLIPATRAFAWAMQRVEEEAETRRVLMVSHWSYEQCERALMRRQLLRPGILAAIEDREAVLATNA